MWTLILVFTFTSPSSINRNTILDVEIIDGFSNFNLCDNQGKYATEKLKRSESWYITHACVTKQLGKP